MVIKFNLAVRLRSVGRRYLGYYFAFCHKNFRIRKLKPFTYITGVLVLGGLLIGAALHYAGTTDAVTITSVTPNGGSIVGGQTITVNGTGFLVDLNWKQISAGSNHTCAISVDDTVYCWGGNTNGQLGDNTTTQRNVPTPIYDSVSGTKNGLIAGKTVKQISAGGGHTCAIASDNKAYCWGLNGNGQLGDNTTTNKSVPTLIRDTSTGTNNGLIAGKTVKQIVASNFLSNGHTCAIASDDTAYCWGSNSTYGQLGDNTTTNKSVPTPIYNSSTGTNNGLIAGKTVKQISAGNYHTCAIASDDTAYCWGNNGNGQLGDNTTTNKSVPTLIRDTSTGTNNGLIAGKTVKQISASGNHTCAIASDDTVYCWGNNAQGQLGDNTAVNKSVSTPVYNSVTGTTNGLIAGKTVKQIAAASGGHTCAIASDDTVYCWGYNYYGQLGDNTTTNRSVPTPIRNTSTGTNNGLIAGKTVKQITAGGSYHTCAITSDNAVYCWGYNNNSQLGDNSITNRSVSTPIDISSLPTQIPTITLGGASCTNVTVISDTQLTCETPAHAVG
ncbi:IPT/TIG domain-containing protein, partial [Candidatus Saccharibacteria bacterium]|nr:IPT/TIG domain-containing protein [Candidatus Saccharibacteria bacterium]